MMTYVTMRCLLFNAGLIFAVILVQLPLSTRAQKSLLGVVTSEDKADAFFSDGSYSAAASSYGSLLSRQGESARIKLKLARCHFHLGNFEQACRWFDAVLQARIRLDDADRLIYAEVLASQQRYPEAAEQYAHISNSGDGDLWIQKKIWRFKNIHFLYEDSAQYSVRKLQINSASGEFGATPFRKGLVFLSNRKPREMVRKIDAASGEGFFKLYHSRADSVSPVHDFGKPMLFSRALQSKYHNGPLCFFDNGNKVAYTATSELANKSGERKLEIRFAEKTEKGWKRGSEFPFNESTSSTTDPFVAEDGSVLFFSSDRKGGFGGKDLYRSHYRNGRWETPVNLGELINTPLDERFPFLNEEALFFSSNGQPGFGGLDMFKAPIRDEGYGDVENLGYPANTSSDDFGLVLLEEGYKGYFSSSRSAGTGDDIFEIQIDQQSYPLVIDGVLKIKEYSWIASDSLKVLPGAAISLIDHTRNVKVWDTRADETGRFSLRIPYFSFYGLRVVHADGSEAFVSFEIPRKKKEDYFHEIVIVRDAFSGRQEKPGYD
jgi:tetratricopeptide (TPR) repeat protein